MLFEYYRENKFFAGNIDQLFPPGDDAYSIVQALILDLGHLESQKLKFWVYKWDLVQTDPNQTHELCVCL